jgi:hypothetical protein
MLHASAISLLTVAMLSLAARGACALDSGHSGRVSDEVIAATRIEPLSATPAPSLLSTAVAPVVELSSPVAFVQTASIPLVLTAPVPELAVATAGNGPLRDTPGLAPCSALNGPLRDTPGLAIAMAVKGPLRDTAGFAVSTISNGPLPDTPAFAGTAVLTPPSASAPRDLAPPEIPLLPPDFSALTAARLVRDGLADGTLNPRNPAWRPHLAFLLAHAASTPEADSLFASILAGCAGYDDRSKLATAEAWAGSYESGRFAATIAYSAARRSFTSGDYAATVSRCERMIVDHSGATDRAMLLLALVQAQTGDRTRALLTLNDIRSLYPESSVAPEALFMEAWLALQDSRNEDAIAILREIVTETPHAPAAVKATRMLADLEGVK